MMKRFITLSAVVLFSISTAFSQAPANSNAVMLQGFYWDSNDETSWNKLCELSGELSGNFDIVWLPPSGWAGDYPPNTGYMPIRWCDQNSTWGAANTLKQLIATLKSNGCRAMADIVVNHKNDNGIAPYLSFYPEDFGSYGIWQLGLSDIVSNDDAPGGTGETDDGQGFDGARDLDHKSTNVQNTVKAYLKWLKDKMGYDAWRYDMVKGFRADVIGQYNDEANAYMSVGEHWSGDGEIKTWIDYTGKKSAAFDFPLKYDGLRDGLASGNYGNMARGIAFDPNYRRYAVTFVDNHDTYRDGSKYLGDVLQAYAFLMSSPGIPCVFYPHWKDNKTAINDMIKARKSIGMTNETNVDVQNTYGYYKAFIEGSAGMMLTYIGNNGGDAPGDPGWNLVASGGSGNTSYKIYTNISNPNLLNEHQQKINSGTNCTARPTFNTITIDAIVPAAWTAPKIHVWVVGGTEITTWPGKAMTKVSENHFRISLPDPNFTASEVGIVINNGVGANPQQTINLYAEGNVCFEVENTPSGEKYIAKVSTSCQSSGVNNIATHNLNIYPNPAINTLHIDSENAISKVTVLSVSGKSIITSMENTIDVSALSTGIYLLKIELANSQVIFDKFLKK